MEQKVKALRVSSKVIAVITKIGYIVMLVMVILCAVTLAFLAVTGGTTSMFVIGGTSFIVFDEVSSTPAELMGVCAVLIVMGAIFFAIFRLAYRMFHEISVTGDPFVEKYGRTFRAVGILTAAMPIVVGIAETVASFFVATEIPELYTDVPGIVVGAIIFCISYIIDYGCGLKKESV